MMGWLLTAATFSAALAVVGVWRHDKARRREIATRQNRLWVVDRNDSEGEAVTVHQPPVPRVWTPQPDGTDAREWAATFCAHTPTDRIDDELMYGWFANAIMAGYDEGYEAGRAAASAALALPENPDTPPNAP